MSVALIKLVVHPLLAAASPSASNVALLAERFSAKNRRIARVILLSTELAFFSFWPRWLCWSESSAGVGGVAAALTVIYRRIPGLIDLEWRKETLEIVPPLCAMNRNATVDHLKEA